LGCGDIAFSRSIVRIESGFNGVPVVVLAKASLYFRVEM
jgi:hypothetical protein